MKNRYIAEAFKVLHEWWRYILGLAVAIFGVFVFSIPHGIAISVKMVQDKRVDASLLNDPTYLLGLFEPNLNLVFILLPFAGGLLFLLAAVKWIHKQSILSLTTIRKNFDWKRFWIIFFCWGLLTSGLVFIDYIMSPEDYALNFQLHPFLILCVIAIILVPIQTSFEEYLFRGYLMQGIGVGSVNRNFPFVILYFLLSIVLFVILDNIYGLVLWQTSLYVIAVGSLLLVILSLKLLDNITQSDFYQRLYSVLKRNSTPLIITSLIFGLLHIANPEVDKLGPVIMVYYIGTGLFLGIMTLMDEGMELSLGFHAANNLFTALLVTSDWTAFQTHSIFKDLSNPESAGFVDVFMPVFVIFPVILIILGRIYKWSDWKEKLFGEINPPALIDNAVHPELNPIGIDISEENKNIEQ